MTSFLRIQVGKSGNVETDDQQLMSLTDGPPMRNQSTRRAFRKTNVRHLMRHVASLPFLLREQSALNEF